MLKLKPYFKMENTYKNIPGNAFIVVDTKRESVRRRISTVVTALVTLSLFAYAQLVEGLQIRLDGSNAVSKSEMNLLLKLVRVYNLESLTVELTDTELAFIRSWIESRIAHCEEERDARAMINLTPNTIDETLQEKFNPDTYIGLKLLLLDIRELMLGEIINESYKDLEFPKAVR